MKYVRISCAAQVHHDVRVNRVLDLGAVLAHQPLMLEGHRGQHSLLRVRLEHALHELLGFGAVVVPDDIDEFIVAGGNLANEVRVVLAHEGWEACQHEVCDDAHGPDVAIQVVVLAFEDLGRHEVQRAGVGPQIDFGVTMVRELGHPEVNQLDPYIVDVARTQTVDHNIIKLEVPVHNAL